ncbi:MAG: cob(I)yrinic acid a,c-diamide adenosyltransferase [Eubacteriales bacterium]|nr:cob(I)yrinic acid a,c-diamide adenosyltransferase [Eubacteriales bacterium]
MIHLYSGNGRGKTSIAIGTAIRMAGANRPVLFAQFMKGNDTSELAVLQGLSGVRVLRVEEQFPFYKHMSEQDKQAITQYHNEILSKIMQEVSKYAKETKEDDLGTPVCLVVLDEVTYPLQYGLMNQELFHQFLDTIPDCVELIMTGRNPSEKLMQVCDYWSELEMQKHPYEKGIMARKGIEY